MSDEHTVYKHLLHRGRPRGARSHSTAAAAACAAAAAAAPCTWCAAAARLSKRGRASRPVALAARERVVVEPKALEAGQPHELR